MSARDVITKHNENTMARFSRIEIAQLMGDQGMVPLFFHSDIEVCKAVVEACYRGGARLLEFTNRGERAHKVFDELSAFCASTLPDMVLGAGSIPDAATAALFVQLGANFIVTPSLREDVARVCNRRKVLWVPGCGSLTEIGHAEELGAEIVKLFPGSVYGPEFIKAVRAPQPWTLIMPTGGVAPQRNSLEAWFQAGAWCVGMGSKLMAKKSDGSYDIEAIERLTRDTLALIRQIRSGG